MTPRETAAHLRFLDHLLAHTQAGSIPWDYEQTRPVEFDPTTGGVAPEYEFVAKLSSGHQIKMTYGILLTLEWRVPSEPDDYCWTVVNLADELYDVGNDIIEAAAEHLNIEFETEQGIMLKHLESLLRVIEKSGDDRKD